MKHIKPTSYIQAAILAVILAASTSLFSGCAVLKSPATAQRVATATKVASYIGASEYLRTHPETRPAFEIARDELKVIEGSEVIDFTVLLAIVHRLPVKELQSPRATMIVTASTILLTDYLGAIPTDSGESLKLIAKNMRQGLDLALQ